MQRWQGQAQHRRGRSFTGVGAMKEHGHNREEEEDLALFHDMDKLPGDDRHTLLLNTSDEFESRLANAKLSSSPIYKITMPAAATKAGGGGGRGGSDDFLITDGEKNDYDWLLTPPGTPLFPSLEMKAQATGFPRGSTMPRPATALKASRLSNLHNESSSKNVRGSLTTRQTISSTANSSTNMASGRSSIHGISGPASSRPSTPTTRSTGTATLKSSVPTTRSTGPAPSRPSTPTARSIVPASRSTVPPSKSLSRPSTPTRRPSTPSLSQSSHYPSIRSSSASKISSMPSRYPPASRGNSPSPKPRPSQPPLLPGFSPDTPPNLRTTMPERPPSATRGRPGAPSSVRPTTEIASASSRQRRQSCSPSVTRGRVSNESHHNDRSMLRTNKPQINGTEVTIPVVLGNKMVDKVMSARPATRRHEDQAISRCNTSTLQNKRLVKSTPSPDSSGFGRTISKSSLDMALRHMDIGQSTPISIRPLTGIPASSLYSVRSGSVKGRLPNIFDSPIATSSNASSEHSALITPYPEGNALDDYDFATDRENRVACVSEQDSILFKGDGQSTNWLHSPENREDKFDQTLLFHEKLDSFDVIVSSTGMDTQS